MTIPLCPPLAEILDGELNLGNKIKEVVEFGWSEIDLSVVLKFPFKRNYQALSDLNGISFYRQDSDPYYSFEDSYISSAHRQALSAPVDSESKYSL